MSITYIALRENISRKSPFYIKLKREQINYQKIFTHEMLKRK